MRGVELGQGQRHAVGRRLGRAVDGDAHAVGLDLREAGEERGGVPVGPHAVDRDVERDVGDLLGVGGGRLVAAEVRRHRVPRRVGGVADARWRGGGWTPGRRAARSARRRTRGARRATRAAAARPARRRATSEPPESATCAAPWMVRAPSMAAAITSATRAATASGSAQRVTTGSSLTERCTSSRRDSISGWEEARSWSARMTCMTALMRARCVKACGKLPRWRPERASISSA